MRKANIYHCIHHFLMMIHVGGRALARNNGTVYYMVVTRLSDPIRTIARNCYYGIKDNPMELTPSTYQHQFTVQTKEQVKIVL